MSLSYRKPLRSSWSSYDTSSSSLSSSGLGSSSRYGSSISSGRLDNVSSSSSLRGMGSSRLDYRTSRGPDVSMSRTGLYPSTTSLRSTSSNVGSSSSAYDSTTRRPSYGSSATSRDSTFGDERSRSSASTYSSIRSGRGLESRRSRGGEEDKEGQPKSVTSRRPSRSEKGEEKEGADNLGSSVDPERRVSRRERRESHEDTNLKNRTHRPTETRTRNSELRSGQEDTDKSSSSRRRSGHYGRSEGTTSFKEKSEHSSEDRGDRKKSFEAKHDPEVESSSRVGESFDKKLASYVEDCDMKSETAISSLRSPTKSSDVNDNTSLGEIKANKTDEESDEEEVFIEETFELKQIPLSTDVSILRSQGGKKAKSPLSVCQGESKTDTTEAKMEENLSSQPSTSTSSNLRRLSSYSKVDTRLSKVDTKSAERHPTNAGLSKQSSSVKTSSTPGHSSPFRMSGEERVHASAGKEETGGGRSQRGSLYRSEQDNDETTQAVIEGSCLFRFCLFCSRYLSVYSSHGVDITL